MTSVGDIGRNVAPADAALQIAGLLRARRSGRRVAGADRMTIEEVVKRVFLDEQPT